MAADDASFKCIRDIIRPSCGAKETAARETAGL
jgi:hypothetical protein